MIVLPHAFLQRPLAHRGLHDAAEGRIENSASAIEAAISAGYGIEIDVQLTSDGHALVFHDALLDRLTGETGRVRDRTLADLKTIPLRGISDCAPSLAEVVRQIAGRAPLLIEAKSETLDTAESMARAVASALRNAKGPIAVMSFEPEIIRHLSQHAPEVPRGLTTMDFTQIEDLPAERSASLTAISDFDAVGASFISHDKASLDGTAVERLRAAEVPVLTWTIRSPEEAHDALKRADNITFEGYLPDTPRQQA